MKFLKGGRTIILVYRVVGIVTQYVLMLVLARFFDTIDVGRFILGRTIMRMGGTVSSLGINSGIIKYIQCFQSEGNEGNISKAIVVGLTIVGLFSLLAASALFLLSGWIASVAFEDPGMVKVLRGFAVGIPLFTVFTFELGVLRGLKKAEVFSFSENVLYNVTVLVTVFGTCFYYRDVLFGVYSIVASCLLLVVFCAFVIARCVRKMNKATSPWNRGELVRYSFPIMGSGLISMLLVWSDSFMLGILGSVEDVGVYAIVNRLIFATNIFVYSAGAKFAPEVARINADKTNDLGEVYKNAAAWVRRFGIPLVVGLLIVGKFVLGIFGEEYIVGFSALVFLGVGQFTSLWIGPASYILTMTGAQKVDFVIRIATLVINIILNVLLVPRFGMAGCAVATSASLICCNTMVVTGIYKYRKISVF